MGDASTHPVRLKGLVKVIDAAKRFDYIHREGSLMARLDGCYT